MHYRGSYNPFDPTPIKTYPLKTRKNKVEVDGFVNLAALAKGPIAPPTTPWFRNGYRGQGLDQSAGLAELANYLVACRRDGKPVVVLSGGHPIKNGQNPIVIDLMRRGLITLYATNVAATIHSFELALTGASSESVRDALPTGEFGMAFETGHYLNYAQKVGMARGYGLGECMGRLYADAEFRKTVLDRVFADYPDTGDYLKPYDGFPYADSCVYAAAWEHRIPICVHASLGFDIIDQLPSFDGQAKGATSGVDFQIFTNEMCKFARGGVILTFGSAVMAPEVTLKAVSMAANVGARPDGLWTADFDVRPFVFDDDARDESHYYYYLRDQKSLATRIPKVFGGVGFYFQGLHAQTVSAFYQFILSALRE
jgi:hypothetical protein